MNSIRHRLLKGFWLSYSSGKMAKHGENVLHIFSLLLTLGTPCIFLYPQRTYKLVAIFMFNLKIDSKTLL